MTNWDKIGKIKAAILVLCALPNFFLPLSTKTQMPLLAILAPLIFGIVAIPLVTKSGRGREIIKLTWNDNPLKLKRPLSFFHFGAYFFVVIGLSVLISSAIKYKILSEVGLICIFYGVGILIGIQLTLIQNKNK
jgi:hypothetical protein